MNAVVGKLVKPSWQKALSTAERQASYKCTAALLGGRFPDLRSALSHPEFQSASARLVRETLELHQSDNFAVKAASDAEELRRHKEIEDFVKSSGKDGASIREDMAWLESIFEDKLMSRADRNALTSFTVDELRTFHWCFELASRDDRRYWAYKFQYTVYADLVAAAQNTSESCYVQGGNRLQSLATTIFTNGAYCTRQIKDNVAKGLSERPDQGRPTNFPRDVESVAFRFASMLRSHNLQVYKSTMIMYGMRLLAGTEASLNFAIVKDGKFVPSARGGVEWDMGKWNDWFKRRFVGDRKHNGAHMSNQALIDARRAKWHSFEAMMPYFMTHVQALVDEGIAVYNLRSGTRPRESSPASARADPFPDVATLPSRASHRSCHEGKAPGSYRPSRSCSVSSGSDAGGARSAS